MTSARSIRARTTPAPRVASRASITCWFRHALNGRQRIPNGLRCAAAARLAGLQQLCWRRYGACLRRRTHTLPSSPPAIDVRHPQHWRPSNLGPRPSGQLKSHRRPTATSLPRHLQTSQHHQLAPATPEHPHRGRIFSLPVFHRERLRLNLQLNHHQQPKCLKGNRLNHIEDEGLLGLDRAVQDSRLIIYIGLASASDAPKNRPLQRKVLFLGLRSDKPGWKLNCHVFDVRCKAYWNRGSSDGYALAPFVRPHTVRVNRLCHQHSQVTTSSSTTSHHRGIALSSRRLWATHTFAAVEGLWTVCTIPARPDSSDVRASENWTLSIPGGTSLCTRPRRPSQRRTDKTACTPRCAVTSGNINENDHKTEISLSPATP